MEKVKAFIEDFIQAEISTQLARLKPNLDAFNKKLAAMDTFLSENLKTRFGMLYLTELKSTGFYETAQNMEPITPRHLFVIRESNDKKRGNLYSAYVSDISSNKSYFDCLIVKPEGENLLIISRFTFGYGRDGRKEKHWYFSGGEEMDFSSLKTVTNVLHLVAPEDDEDSMKDYLKDLK